MEWGNVSSLTCSIINDPDVLSHLPPGLGEQCSAVVYQGWVHSCLGDRGDRGKLSVDQSICREALHLHHNHFRR